MLKIGLSVFPEPAEPKIKTPLLIFLITFFPLVVKKGTSQSSSIFSGYVNSPISPPMVKLGRIKNKPILLIKMDWNLKKRIPKLKLNMILFNIIDRKLYLNL